MKTFLKLLMTGLVLLLVQAYAQEPKHAVVAQDPATEASLSREQTIATGTPERRAPVVQPKPLPRLSPSLGEIARANRAAHAAVPKAQVVLTDDATPEK